MKLEDVLKRAVVIYATRYGSTEELAEQIADGLGIPAKKVEEFQDRKELDKYDLMILGTPIYSNDIMEDMRHFIHTFYPYVASKNLILFTVHGVLKGEKGSDYPKTFAKYFSKKPMFTINLFGRATRGTMTKKDYKKLWIFYKNRLKVPFKDFDYIGQNDLATVVADIKKAIIKNS